MADKLPVVIGSDLFAQLQSGDLLVDPDGHGYVDSENAFGTDDVLVASDGTARGVKATAIDKDDVVTADTAFGTDNLVIIADGTGKGVEASGVVIHDTNHVESTRTVGANNVSFGNSVTMGNLTSGSSNAAFGGSALRSLEDSSNNMAMGTNALFSLVTEVTGANVAFGFDAMFSLTTGHSNFAGGTNSLRAMTSGVRNMGLGASAGRSVLTGDDNVFLGVNAGNNAGQATAVDDAICIGAGTWVTGSNAVAIGVGVSAGADQVVIGDSSHTDVFFPGILTVTSDPVSAGQLWVENGFVRISDGSIAPNVNDDPEFFGFVTLNDDTTPPGTPSNAIWLYSLSAELHIVDGAGNDINTSDMVTADADAGSSGLVMQSAGADKTIEASAVEVADLVTYPLTRFEQYGSGTGYTFTTTPAAIAMGTDDPVITITTPGTYRISAWVEWSGQSTDDVNLKQMTLTIRRTNNTAADLTNGTTNEALWPTSGGFNRRGSTYWEAGEYTTANSDDQITIFVSLNSTTDASAVVARCFIKAERVA